MGLNHVTGLFYLLETLRVCDKQTHESLNLLSPYPMVEGLARENLGVKVSGE